MLDLLDSPVATRAAVRRPVLCALLLTALIAGCGGNEDGSGQTGTDGAGSQAPVPDDSGGGAAADPALLKAAAEAISDVRSQPRTCGQRAFGAAPEVSGSAQLAEAALDHSTWMRDTNSFSHTGANGSDVGTRVSTTGYSWRTVGENLAGGHADVNAVVQAWVTSAEHCANLMNPAFADIGVARVEGGATNDFRSYWTLVLAAR